MYAGATPSSTVSTACVSRLVGRPPFDFFGCPPSPPLTSPPTGRSRWRTPTCHRCLNEDSQLPDPCFASQCIDGRVHPAQRFIVHDRPTRESQNWHLAVLQHNPMRRHVCCRCGSRAQSVRPPRARRCGGGDGGATTALRHPAPEFIASRKWEKRSNAGTTSSVTIILDIRGLLSGLDHRALLCTTTGCPKDPF